MLMRLFQGRFGSRTPDVEALTARADTARLVGALRHPEPAVRVASATALGQIGDLRAAPDLIDALKDDEWEVRRSAVRALGCLQVGCAEPQLPAAVEKQQNASSGSASVWSRQKSNEQTTGAFLSERIEGPLVKVLHDEVWQVREAAAETLALVGPRTQDQITSNRLVEALLVTLGDERLAVRKAAAESLASLGTSHLEALNAALIDTDRRRQEGATIALGRLGQGAKDSVLQAEVVAVLVTALSDPDPWLRLASVRALGQIGQSLEKVEHRQQIVEPLTLRLQDRDGQVRESTARALGRIGDARAAGPLVELLQDPKKSVQNAAAQALDRLARAQGIQTGPVHT